MNILVTDGDSRAALAITRSLGSKGHRVYVGSVASSSLAASSCYCHRALRYPDPTVNRDEFLAALRRQVAENNIEILIPVTDVCVLPVAEHRELFEDNCVLPLPEFSALQAAADKRYLLQCAQELGVAVPASIAVERPDALSGEIKDLEPPVVIKPCRSRVPDGDGWISTTVDYAVSLEELEQKLDKLPKAVFPVLLQERIQGPGIGHFYCFREGEPVASFAHRRIREKPPSGGVSVLRESVALHPQAHDFSIRLLRRLNWHGVAMVEYKLDERDRTPRLMEINGRFWGSLQLAIDAGMDFPGILTDIAQGKSVSYAGDYRTGVRTRWLWGDIDLLLMLLLKSNAELNLPAGHESRMRTIARILKPYNRNQLLEVLRPGDIRPWLYESRKWFTG